MAGNIADWFGQHLARPDRVLYRHHVDDGWRDVTVGELATRVARWQAAFRRDGLAEGDRVALCGRNGLEWVAIDLAALAQGLVVVPLYVDDNPENVAWCVGNAEARLLIVENRRLAAGLARLAAAERIALPRVVVLRGDDAGDAAATPVDAFLPDGHAPVEIRALPPSALATICYTSGTSGRPKGVMLTHGNIIADVVACRGTGMARPDDTFLSVLPLSHMFERTGGYYLPLSLGAKVVFARGVMQLADDLATQRPTIMFAVPRIFERFRARLAQAVAGSPLKSWLFDQCVARGYRIAQGTASPLDRMLAPLLRAKVAAPVLARLGGRLRLAVVGGAALDPEISRTFIGLGLTMLQGYGMTEAAPVISVNREGDNVPESVGPAAAGRRGAHLRRGRAAGARRQRDAGLLAQRGGDARRAGRRLAAHRRPGRDPRRSHPPARPRQGHHRAVQRREAAAAGRRARDHAGPGVRAGDAGRRGAAVRPAARGVAGNRREGAAAPRQRSAEVVSALDPRAPRDPHPRRLERRQRVARRRR